MRMMLPVVTGVDLERASVKQSNVGRVLLAEENTFQLAVATVRHLVYDRVVGRLSPLTEREMLRRIEVAKRSFPTVLSDNGFVLDDALRWATWMATQVLKEGELICLEQRLEIVLSDSASTPYLLRLEPKFMLKHDLHTLEIVDLSLQSGVTMWLRHWCSAAAAVQIHARHVESLDGVYSTILYPRTGSIEPVAFSPEDFQKQNWRVRELASQCRKSSVEFAIRDVDYVLTPSSTSTLAWQKIQLTQATRNDRAS